MVKPKNKYHVLEVAFKKGDKDAFKSLYNLYYDKLFIYINSIANNESLSQDIVQDTFLKVWTSRDNFDINQPLGGYLYKTAYNTFIDTCRKTQKNHKLIDSIAYKRMTELAEEDDFETERKIKCIKKAIEKLPPKCKEIFLMSKYQSYKYVEIAEHLQLSIKTVETQMRKAFSLIRKEVKSIDHLNLFLYFSSRILSVCRQTNLNFLGQNLREYSHKFN